MNEGENLSQSEKPASGNSINLNIRRTTWMLEFISLGFLAASLFGQSLRYWTNFEEAFGLVPLFNIAATFSMPTVYSVLLLLLLALLFGIIWSNQIHFKGKFHRQWIFLTILTIYLSVNRGTHVHNLLISPVVRLLRRNIDFFPFSRLNVTILLLVLIFIFFFRRFYLSLPKKTRSRLLIAALVYLAGFSLLTVDPGFLASSGEFVQTIYISFGKILEMSGMVLLIGTCLDYINQTNNSILLEFKDINGENRGKTPP